MAAHAPSESAREIHHQIPQCLLRLRDRAEAHRDFDGEGIQLWLEFELEALRYGVAPDVSRDDLDRIMEGSTMEVSREEHRNEHSEASDFVRWGRRGGLATLRRYGTAWFSLLARRRWKKITATEILEAFPATSDGRY